MKAVEDEDLENPVLQDGDRVVFAARRMPVAGMPDDASSPGGQGSPTPLVVGTAPRPLGNSQDADESTISIDVPGWQMPQLVVECARRPGARIHKGTSLILPDAGGDLIAGIVAHLPVLQQIRPCWHLGYSMAVDGVSLRTLYRQVMEAGPCLLVLEDSNFCIFGAFASEGLRPQNRCHGTHESFIFRYPRAAGAWRTEVFRWSDRCESRAAEPLEVESAEEETDDNVEPDSNEGEASSATYQGARAGLFEALQKVQMSAAVGAPTAEIYCDHTGIVVGIDGPAIFVDQDLLRGVSCPSKAFRSPCMAAAGSGADFVIRNLEVWHWVG